MAFYVILCEVKIRVYAYVQVHKLILGRICSRNIILTFTIRISHVKKDNVEERERERERIKEFLAKKALFE